ncbi:helix-turn-helix transcriptional regulator [Halosolutus gelatinilyticus]|uniref:helix-turn-helix transcriptional regulator n=1 Tax=Halosolutus gelatinilyticus TaxID=2931975 RepID=UPI001FF352DF|nr:MarR family transcriptional regulator [Halosolutus gelatinilyticus]
MNPEPIGTDLEDDLLELVRRHEVFTVLANDPLEKPELASALDVSPATTHRILTSFRENDWIARTDGGYALTPLGERMGRAVRSYRSAVVEARRLTPLYDLLFAATLPVEVEPDVFADATVTTIDSHDPYRPLNRFIDLLGNTDSLRGIDTTSVAPTYVEDVHERIVDGMPVEIVFETPVIDRLATEYADLAEDAFDRENLTLWAIDDLPFGLALFDDRVGIGRYDDEVGFLSVFVDTDDDEAYAWGERVFEHYRSAATRVV